MSKERLRVLGINPGTRYVGVAAFYGNDLIDWGVKSFNGEWSPEKLRKSMATITDLIGQYKPNALAIKELHPSRSSKGLNQFVRKLEKLDGKKGLKVFRYSIEEIETVFIQDGSLNKKTLAEAVAVYYPVLFHELEKEKNHRNPYYIRMFEAVALGAICINKLDK